MKPSSSFCLPISPKEKNKIIWRSGVLLFWILTVAIFIFLFISSPNQILSDDDERPKQNLYEATSALPIKQDKDEEACDLFAGRWIWNPNGALYTNRTCKTMPESKNCGKHGKEDKVLVNWRWKPNGCELPRFNAQAFLEIVRGKKLAFIGDSVARNQMESLLCLLSQVETPVVIFKTADDKTVAWHFPTHEFTLMTLWTKFLVEGTPRLINGSDTGVIDIRVDKIDSHWIEKLPELDYAIISDGHWFFRRSYLYEGNSLIGCVFCDEANVTNLGLGYAIRRAFQTALKHINRCRKCKGLITLVRTFSPAHFEYGAWNGGGRCNRTTPMAENELSLGGTEWEVRSIQVEELERAKVEGLRRGKRFGFLDVTRAMLLRPDGHPDTHWNNNWMAGYSDCVHWCLPGPIDTWNDLLLEILKNDAYTSQGSIISS